MQSQAIIEKIEQKLKSYDPAKRTTFKIFQFHFKKSDGSILKSYVLDLKDLKIYEGTVQDADGEITVGDEDFFAWATKKAPFEELKSKIVATGDVESIKKVLEKFHE